MKVPAVVAVALALLAGGAQVAQVAKAEPAVIASAAYPEGLLWHGGKLYVTEMGADRVSIIEEGGTTRYANGVNFDPATRTLSLSAHLARRVHDLTLDGRQRVPARRVLIDFAQVPAARSHSFPLAGPDGIALRPGLIAVAEYGEG